MARDEKLDLMHRIPLFSGIDRRGLERLGMLSDEIDDAPREMGEYRPEHAPSPC